VAHTLQEVDTAGNESLIDPSTSTEQSAQIFSADTTGHSPLG
jgi:hypothetical protein